MFVMSGEQLWNFFKRMRGYYGEAELADKLPSGSKGNDGIPAKGTILSNGKPWKYYHTFVLKHMAYLRGHRAHKHRPSKSNLKVSLCQHHCMHFLKIWLKKVCHGFCFEFLAGSGSKSGVLWFLHAMVHSWKYIKDFYHFPLCFV